MRAVADDQMTSLMKELDRNAQDGGELHRLEVLFHHLGPAPERQVDLVAALCAVVRPAPTAVRGATQLRQLEVEAGPHRIMLELRPASGCQTVEIHGQLVTHTPHGDDAHAVLSWGDGELRTSTVDAHGEFHFGGVPTATYRLTWHLGGQRIVLAALAAEEGVPHGEAEGPP